MNHEVITPTLDIDKLRIKELEFINQQLLEKLEKAESEASLWEWKYNCLQDI